MAEKELDATQSGADKAGEAAVIDTAAQVAAQDDTPKSRGAFDDREDEVERIAAQRRAKFEREEGVKLNADATPESTAAAPAVAALSDATPAKLEDLSVSAQIGKQLEDGTLVLTAADLARVKIVTKVDGNEELVAGDKALGQYQKNSAADVRLAEATRMSKEAADLLQGAKDTTAAATTATAAKAAEVVTAKDSEELGRLTEEHAQAVYAGDHEKAAELFNKMFDLKLKGRDAPVATPAPSVEDLVERALPVLQQRQSVDSALTKLLQDYPEISNDSDLSTLADIRRAGYEAQGKSRAEAIALAGEAIGEKYSLGKFAKKDVTATADTTTRDLKLAAKEGLDEPKSAATRAASSVPLPQTPSQKIAEMAREREPQKAA